MTFLLKTIASNFDTPLLLGVCQVVDALWHLSSLTACFKAEQSFLLVYLCLINKKMVTFFPQGYFEGHAYFVYQVEQTLSLLP